jgi:hypothetical protein
VPNCAGLGPYVGHDLQVVPNRLALYAGRPEESVN